LDLGITSLGTCSLCGDDPCVQVSSNFVSHSSRIKVEKKVSGWTGHIPPFSKYVRASKAGHVRRIVFSPMFVVCFSHILLTRCPIVHIFSVVFVTLSGTFLRCWLVSSSPSCRV
jgi:hypothetical protein